MKKKTVRRGQKPPKTPFIAGLLAAIPFLNSTDDKAELTRLAEKSIPAPLAPDAFRGVFPPTDPELVSHLRHTRDLCREMLRVSLWGEDYRAGLMGLPFNQAEEIRAAEEAKIEARNTEISAVLNTSRVDVYWRHQGYTTFIDKLIERDEGKQTTPKEHAEILRARLVWWIVEAFNSQAGKPGAAWVGFCPRCHEVFGKARTNQVYCGFKCQSAEKQRRYDKKIAR